MDRVLLLVYTVSRTLLGLGSVILCCFRLLLLGFFLIISLWYSIRNCFFLSPDGDLKEETSNTEQLVFSERLYFHLKPILWHLVGWTELVGGRLEVTHHSLPSLSTRKSVVSCSLSHPGADDRWAIQKGNGSS